MPAFRPAARQAFPFTIVGACASLCAALAACVALLAGCGSNPASIDAKVVRVVDGDTIVVETSDGRERVRYIGVDTPESVKPNTPVQCWAKKASALNHRLVAGQTITLKFDRERRDRYGRLLAYPIRPDGLDVGAELVRQGAARTLSISPNTSHAGMLSELQAEAQRKGIGMWSECSGGYGRKPSLLRSTG